MGGPSHRIDRFGAPSLSVDEVEFLMRFEYWGLFLWMLLIIEIGVIECFGVLFKRRVSWVLEGLRSGYLLRLMVFCDGRLLY